MSISYDYYRIFYYVAKYKSFSAAANALVNSQPNLTRSIKRLEQELGCRLFMRKRNGVELTPEGEKLFHHVSIAFEHILTAEEQLSVDESLESGLVSISASEIALHCALLPVLHAFHTLYPKVKIRVSNHSTPEALHMLQNGLSDLAIVTTPVGTHKNLESHTVKSIQEVPICNRSFLSETDNSISWSQLSHLPIISLGKGTNSYAFYSDLFSKKGIPFEPDIEVATADQIIPFVENNLGIGFVPDSFLQKHEDLTALTLDIPIPKREICLLKRTNANLSIATKKLEQMILEEQKK